MIVKQFLDLSRWTSMFLRDAPFRPREETITESLLIEITRAKLTSSLVVKASQGDESRRGHDWAWAIETPAGWMSLMVQAKQISADSPARYKELGKDSARVQARKLINAARKARALPVYALFNSDIDPFGADGWVVTLRGCLRSPLVRSAYASLPPWTSRQSAMGVTLAAATDIRDRVTSRTAKSSHAVRVNEIAMPWECLFCPAWQAPVWNVMASELPGISRAAVTLATHMRAEELEERVLRAPFPRWLSSAPPEWASAILNQAPLDPDFPRETETSLPAGLPRNIGYAVVTRPGSRAL